MHLDLLVAEIGSTTTLVNGFTNLESEPRFVGQGQAPTTVLEGDVCLGLEAARRDLARNLGLSDFSYDQFLATSSAAGGLRMSVHGLVYAMTVQAAKAAALGAGAVICQTTVGKLRDYELEELQEIAPQIILLAGGTDYGERETALYNAQAIASLGLSTPVIYAGNCQNQKLVAKYFASSPAELYLTENVYPKLDALNVEPTRRVIQSVFERHIVQAPGMEDIRQLVTGEIMPTPGAVMQATKLLYEDLGDLVVLDVGGATTDVHSVTPGSEELAPLAIYPEPLAKRTVEGDLGVYVNRHNLLSLLNLEELARELGYPLEPILEDYQPLPATPQQLALTAKLTETAARQALERHVGRWRHLYSAQGRQTLTEGKDLTAVRTLLATGGALTRLPQRQKIMEDLCQLNLGGQYLFPQPHQIQIAYDHHYIMASLGVMSLSHPQAALKLLHRSLNNEPL